MRSHGKPVLAAIAGFFFGVSLSLLFLAIGALALNSILLAIFPILFLILGIVWAYWAPIGRGSAPTAPAAPAPVGRSGFSGGTVAGASGQGLDQGDGGGRTI
jgi:hypothetical protein